MNYGTEPDEQLPCWVQRHAVKYAHYLTRDPQRRSAGVAACGASGGLETWRLAAIDAPLCPRCVDVLDPIADFDLDELRDLSRREAATAA